MNSILKFLKLPPKDRFLLIETYMTLFFSRLILSTTKFKRIAFRLRKPLLNHSFKSEEEQILAAKQIGQAIQIMSRHTFWQTKCFVQALTAKKMLNRRGIPSILYLGMAKDKNKKLTAHAWVISNTILITGGRNINRFTVVSQFGAE